MQAFYLFVLKQIKLKLLTLTFTTKYCDVIVIGDNLIPFQGKTVLEKKRGVDLFNMNNSISDKMYSLIRKKMQESSPESPVQ